MNIKFIERILGLFVCISFLTSCGGTSTGEIDTIIEPPVEIEKTTQPTTLKVFIDASGSMRPYFGDQDIKNITTALSSLNKVVESLEAEYYVWGDETHAIPDKDLTNMLVQKNLKGKASAFDVIFDKMTEIAGRDTLAVLLSDGIISSTPNATSVSEKFTDYDKGTLANEIQKSLKGKGKSVSVYRMKGNFNGNYCNKANKGVPYEGERPFFVFIVGNPDNVRYFDSQVRKGKIADIYKNAEGIYIGTTPEMDFLIEPTDGKDNMASYDDFNREEGTSEYSYSGTQGFRVKAVIPKWIKDSYQANVIKEMSNVEIDGKPTSIKPIVQGDCLIFDISEQIAEKYHDLQESWTIKYVMKDPALKSWEKYSTDDDISPDADHTYLLADLIGAMHKGITGGEENILEAEITIVPQ